MTAPMDAPMDAADYWAMTDTERGAFAGLTGPGLETLRARIST
jgi:hypothetical protein